MAQRTDTERTGVKNDGDFHPSEESMRHHKNEPSGAITQEADAHEIQFGLDENLKKLSTQDLRQRAKSLAIEGWETLERSDLIEALYEYQQNEIRPRRVN